MLITLKMEVLHRLLVIFKLYFYKNSSLSFYILGYWDLTPQAGGVKFSAYITDVGTLTGPLDLVFDNVVINNGNGYDSKNGVFRAPSNGIYSFQFSGQQHSTTAGSTFYIRIEKNGAILFDIRDAASNSENYDVYNNVNYQWELELKEGDEINLKLDDVSTLYTYRYARLYFSGQLISLTK